MKVLLICVIMNSIVALRNLTPVEGLLPVSASNEENGNTTKIFLQEPGLSSLLKITQKNIDIQTRDDLLAIVEDATTENAAAAVANGISKEKLEAEKKKIANAIKANTNEKAKLNAALAANAEAQQKNEDMKAEFLQQKKINADTRAFFEADSRRDPTGAMIQVVEGNEAANARDLKDNANEAAAILKTRDEINKSLEENAQELETLQTTRDANQDALTENATEKIKLDATTAALNLIREVVTKNSEKGPSSLLKITEKNIDMKTRDDLLAIVEDAADKNAAAVIANVNSKKKLEAEKVAITNAIRVILQASEQLNAALAANTEAQQKNEDMKADLRLDAAAFAATRTFLGANPRADPTGDMLKILKGQEATNAAALKDNAEEADALLKTRNEIKRSLTFNVKELNRLRNSKKLNEAALDQNAEEKMKLDSTATAINLIREAITKNSENGGIQRVGEKSATNDDAQSNVGCEVGELLQRCDALGDAEGVVISTDGSQCTAYNRAGGGGVNAVATCHLGNDHVSGVNSGTWNNVAVATCPADTTATSCGCWSAWKNCKELSFNPSHDNKCEQTVPTGQRIIVTALCRHGARECWVLFPYGSKCNKYPGVSGKGWTKDQTVGGVGVHHLATNKEECEARSRGWTNACGFSVQWAWRF